MGQASSAFGKLTGQTTETPAASTSGTAIPGMPALGQTPGSAPSDQNQTPAPGYTGARRKTPHRKGGKKTRRVGAKKAGRRVKKGKGAMKKTGA